MLSFEQNFFEIFRLNETFQVDVSALADRYRELQGETHPDRFAQAAEAEKMRAVQLNSYLNEAYTTLKSPLKRAGYLLKLRDLDPEAVTQEDLNMDSLMEQMQLREKLAELPKDESALAELDKMKAQAKQRLAAEEASFATAIEADDLGVAKKTFHELQFLNKLLHEIEQGEEQRLGY